MGLLRSAPCWVWHWSTRWLEALVRPEVVMRAMQSGEMKQEPAAANQNTQTESDKKSVEWTLERKSVNKVIAYRQEPGKDADKDFGVVFERNGFADWKLTEFRMANLR